ncbi:aldehyde oxidase GLOX [Aristolochia californica]|uniref:aldehyde oxidase GLOX n=1 Tax=Aristolochia californica TaxID=171875 RepID=UPI0035DF106D
MVALRILLAAVLCLSHLVSPTLGDLPGKWELLLEDAGISSMHTAVTHLGTVLLLDRTNSGPSRLRLPHCKSDPSTDKTLNPRCWAHSALFDPVANQLRPLTILTDTWCSSGHFLPDGTLLQTGGDLDGGQKIRKFAPCGIQDRCDWEELDSPRLLSPRWYSTNQILPDGSVVIVGGRAAHSIEYYPRRHRRPVDLPFLSDAEDTQMDNLYPYVHLLPNGHLFIFANTKSILYDYEMNLIVRNYPILEGGPRNYPSGGSSAMLALDSTDFSRAEIIVCGGAQYGVFITRATDIPAHISCGRMVATDADPVWAMEDMPFSRIMGDMVMLPTGDLLIINGAQAGSQGFEMASNPVLFPLLYRPNEPIGLRFMTLNPGQVPRMYHSTANLLPDGRVLIAGSNPHYFYKLNAKFPTELRLEAFSPEYLSPDRANLRPVLVNVPEIVRYGEEFEVEVTVPLPVVGIVEVNFGSAPFATHSFSQGQRLVKLTVSPATPVNDGMYRITCTAPPSGSVAPAGYYMVFAVNQGVPSVGKWVKVLV